MGEIKVRLESKYAKRFTSLLCFFPARRDVMFTGRVGFAFSTTDAACIGKPSHESSWSQ